MGGSKSRFHQWVMGGGETEHRNGRPCTVVRSGGSASNREETQTAPLVEEQSGGTTVRESAEGGEWCLVVISRSLVFGCSIGEWVECGWVG